MSKAVDRTAFLSEPTRLRIAELCREEALTLEEIAASLGRRPGSLSQPKTMRERKALLSGKRKPADGRGPAKTYRLNPAWEEALEEARSRQRPPWATARQDLLLIPMSEMPTACAAIAGGVIGIEWGAQVRGERMGLVLAPESNSDSASTVRVLKALEAVAQIATLELGHVMSPGELREWSARAVREPGSIGQLPPTS